MSLFKLSPKRKLRIKKNKDNHRVKTIAIVVCNITGYLCDPKNTCSDCRKEKERLQEIRKK